MQPGVRSLFFGLIVLSLLAAPLALPGQAARAARFERPIPAAVAQEGTPVPPDLAAQQEITATATVTVTPTITATETTTPTETATPTATPTETPTVTPMLPPGPIYLALVAAEIPPPAPPAVETHIWVSSSAVDIPDNNPNGVSSGIFVDHPWYVSDVNVQLLIDHNYVGDLSVTLTHVESGRQIVLIDRPGMPKREKGCNQPGIRTILDDEMILPVEKVCTQIIYRPGGPNDPPSPAAIAGMFKPEQALSAFDGIAAAGNWVVSVVDSNDFDDGVLRRWRLELTLAEYYVAPPPPTPAPWSPASAYIPNVYAHAQFWGLTCESQVAVDWARYFGYNMGSSDYNAEWRFFKRLLITDNPETGFVGREDGEGAWGYIPPAPYGVHAEPVARVLRDYGVPAYAQKFMTWEKAKAEIAAGRPVYIWTLGAASRFEEPVYYTASDGQTSIVAKYEHVVILVGYDENTAFINSSGREYAVPLTQFLTAWSALANMAITAAP